MVLFSFWLQIYNLEIVSAVAYQGGCEAFRVFLGFFCIKLQHIEIRKGSVQPELQMSLWRSNSANFLSLLIHITPMESDLLRIMKM